jgi:oligogalacturonide lyase
LFAKQDNFMAVKLFRILCFIFLLILNLGAAEVVRDAKEFKVTRLTSNNEELNGVLYFTNNGFTKDDKGIVYVKKINGKWQLMLMDLSTFEIRQLTNSPNIRNLGGVVACKTNELFYSEGEDLHLLEIGTSQDTVIWKSPDGFSYSPISSLDDGNMVSFTITEKIELKTKTDVLHSEAEEKYYKKPLSIIMFGRRNNNQWVWSEVIRIKAWIDHTQLNPADGKTILYSNEGPQELVDQRLWLVNSDGTNNHPVRKEENPSVHITHEFWFDDGKNIGYQNYIPKGRAFGIIDLNDKEKYTEYRLPENNTHNFARFKKNGDVLVMGDGSSKSPYINFYTIDVAKGAVINSAAIIKHDPNISQEYWHQHSRFSSTGRYLIYASANGKKGGDIFLIENIPQ